MDAYETYATREAASQPRFHGQLTPGLQADLAGHYADVAEADCKFIHCVDLPEGRAVPGLLDLRGLEDVYLGKVKLWGKRVVELAPGSGGLSVWLAARAGELVVIDSVATSPTIKRGWWFVKNRLGYEAQVVYSDPYMPPDDLGHFDIAVCAGMFSRGGHPQLALQQVAKLADMLIIAEPLTPPVLKLGETPGAILAPAPEAGAGLQWYFSPSAVTAMLAGAGFGDITISGSTARDAAGNALPHYTMVARRAGVTKIAVAGADLAIPKAPPPPPAPPQAKAVAPLPFADDDAEPEDTLPLPTADGRFSVAGTDDVEVFVVLGRAGYKALNASLRRAGIEAASLGRVLDFGCGVGRVLRYWHAQPRVELHGTDLNPQSINWCRDNLTFASFKTNALEPKLDYPDEYFGLVYALSVFTHLPENIQGPWLRELLRTIRPGGLLYFTTHGDSYRRLLEPDLQLKFDREELIVGGGDDPGSNYCGAFHPPNYVKRRMLEPFGLELVEFLPEGAAGNPTQDSWLVRKAGG